MMNPERKEVLLSVLAKRQPDITVVLENVFDPHNISAVMRTCDAIGIQEIFIVTTRIARHKKWGARSSSGSAKWLTIHQYDNLEECIATLRSRYDKIYTTHLAEGAKGLYEIDFTEKLALVFGNEHAGVSEEIRSLSDGNFIIPQQGFIRSLNISVACAVTLYEAYRQKNNAGHYQRDAMSESVKADLMKRWSLHRRKLS